MIVYPSRQSTPYKPENKLLGSVHERTDKGRIICGALKPKGLFRKREGEQKKSKSHLFGFWGSHRSPCPTEHRKQDLRRICFCYRDYLLSDSQSSQWPWEFSEDPSDPSFPLNQSTTVDQDIIRSCPGSSSDGMTAMWQCMYLNPLDQHWRRVKLDKASDRWPALLDVGPRSRVACLRYPGFALSLFFSLFLAFFSCP